MKSKKIINLIYQLIQSNNYKFNYIFLKELNKTNLKIKKKSIYIFYDKKKIINLIFFYIFLIFNKKKFDFNPILLFRSKNIIYGHNIFPDWPGKYIKQFFLKNFFLWAKNFFYIIFFKKKLFIILLKVY